MGFKSHIEKIIYYPFKLKYLNQKVFYPTLKKHDLQCCHSRSFIKPGPVQPPGRPGPGSTRRAGPGLITMLSTTIHLLSSLTISFIIHVCSCLFLSEILQTS